MLGYYGNKDIWDKLLVSVPVDRKAAIVTDWNRQLDLVVDEVTNGDVSIFTLIDLLEVARLIVRSTSGYQFLQVLKLLSHGQDLESWTLLLSKCSFLDRLRIPKKATLKRIKNKAKELKKEVNAIYEFTNVPKTLKHSHALEIVSLRTGFYSYHHARARSKTTKEII